MFIHILLGVGNVEFRVRAFCLPIESLGVNLPRFQCENQLTLLGDPCGGIIAAGIA